MMTDKYDYDRFGLKAKRVGQAVYDILKRGNEYVPTAEEIAEERQDQYFKDLKQAAELGKKEFNSPFYVVYLFNKEQWSPLVNRGRFVRRQTEPEPENMMTMFPYYQKDVWKVDYDSSRIDYMWTLPPLETFKQILTHKDLYDPALVKWTENCTSEKKPYSELTE
jgi:hypothetical protein